MPGSTSEDVTTGDPGRLPLSGECREERLASLEAGQPTRRPRWIEAVEAASIAAFVFCWGAVVVEIANAVPGQRLLWQVPLSLALGLLFADFVGGAVHWFADTYFDPGTPVLGPLLIEPFRDHHHDPEAIARHGLLELLGNNALATLPFAALLLALGGPGGGTVAQLVYVGLTALALGLLATNEFHCWAHMRRPPRWVGWLQRHRLTLPPEVHARHHQAAHDRSYCVTSGWLNPMLDHLRFFEGVEAALRAIGIRPARSVGPDVRPPVSAGIR